MMTTQDFQLPAEINHGNVEEVIQAGLLAMKSFKAGEMMAINCQNLTQFDSSALSVILSLQRRAQSQSIKIQLIAIPEKLASLAKVYGLADIVLV
jgi:phospholipid transport system transporter-binding protein